MPATPSSWLPATTARAPTSWSSSTSPPRWKDAPRTLDVISRTAEQVFIPLTVGGGVRRDDDVDDLLRAGADKISLNSAAVRDPALLQRCADRFGTQCVVVAIDAKRRADAGGWEVFVDAGRTRHGPRRGRVGGRGLRGTRCRRGARDLDGS